MEAKWPFVSIILFFLGLLGFVVSKLERTNVMNNWDKRRCEFPVMIGSYFFKPDDDPRTSTQFAGENFSFCLKNTIDSFTTLLMKPIQTLFSKQINVTGVAMNMLNIIRNLATTMYKAFTKYLSSFFGKFNFAIFEIRRIIIYIRMAVERLSAIAMSFTFIGITVFRTAINSIQAVIRVVLIVCGIMLAILIILWFILFPFIPIVMSALGTVISIVLIFSMVLSGVLSDTLKTDAEKKKSGFCFSEDTPVFVKTNENELTTKKVKDIIVGDELGYNCGKVTAVIKMDGSEVELYSIDGILVSGSHLVKGTDGIWKEVKEDSRSFKSFYKSSVIYCFNTTSNQIPVFRTTNSALFFRDWEEIDNNDTNGHILWNQLILHLLHTNNTLTSWKQDLNLSSDLPLLHPNYLVKTINGFVHISSIKLSDKILDRNGKEQQVLGIIYGQIDEIDKDENHIWSTSLYEWIDGVWRKSQHTIKHGTHTVNGYYLITETGEIILLNHDNKKERIVRDFTEIGHDRISETYPFIYTRLSSK
jgi:hypothetical protein